MYLFRKISPLFVSRHPLQQAFMQMNFYTAFHKWNFVLKGKEVNITVLGMHLEHITRRF